MVSLVHELPCSYSEEDYKGIYQNSAKLIFPVSAVRELTNRKLPIPFGKDLVLPQGLLDPNFGQSVDRAMARVNIRDELSIPRDAMIVLGCGTLDLRKGIDHFAAIAKNVIRQNNYNNTIHFVWLGDGPRWTHSPFHYVQLDLRNAGVASHVHFVGEREHVDSYFVGSDLFLLSSRVDPFPCVVHEAMAAELPVIAFEDSGGAPVMLADGGGYVLPYADYEAAANVIQTVARNPGICDGIKYRARQRVYAEFNFETYANRIIEIAENVIGQRLNRLQKPREPIRINVAA